MKRSIACLFRSVRQRCAENTKKTSSWEEVYGSEQLAALRKGEEVLAGDPWDRKRPRRAPYGLPYVDDLADLDPVLDYATWEHTDLGKEPHQPLPRIPPGPGLALEEDEGGDVSRLALVTGMDEESIKRLLTRPLVVKRVVNQTRKGKIASMYSLAIAGNGRGMVGYGEGKHEEGGKASRKAINRAIRNMQYIPRYENRTIYGDVRSKFHAVHLTLRNRPPGFGVRANHFIYEICRAAGISDLGAKVLGSRNGMNVVKATFAALHAQRLPEDIARSRGKRIIDVRNVYFN